MEALEAQPGRQHPAILNNTYALDPIERLGFMGFETTDECTAYIDWANREKAAGPARGDDLISRWMGNEPEALDDATREILIQQAADARIVNGDVPPYRGPEWLRYGPQGAVPPEGGAEADVPIRVVVPEADEPQLPFFPPAASQHAGVRWRFHKTLWRPQDGVTSVRSYIGEDAEQRLVDRVVIKDVWQPYYGAPFDAQGEVPPPNPDRSVAETEKLDRAYRLLHRLRGVPHVLQARCRRSEMVHQAATNENGQPVLDPVTLLPLHDWHNIARTYSDECEYGDLKQLIRRYGEDGALDEPNGIPEMFIWIVIKAMADTLHHMKTGLEFDPLNLDEIRPDWRSIIHRNITPANILLKKSPVAGAYPIPMLADFDFADAVPNGETHLRPTTDGTDGYRSPENMDWLRTEPPEWPRTIGPGSDLWGLGNVIWDMRHASWVHHHVGIHMEQQFWLFYPLFDYDYYQDDSTLYPATIRYLHERHIPQPPLPLASRKLERLETHCTLKDEARRATAANAATKARSYLRTAATVIGADPVLHGAQTPGGRLRIRHDPFVMGRRHDLHRNQGGEPG